MERKTQAGNPLHVTLHSDYLKGHLFIEGEQRDVTCEGKGSREKKGWKRRYLSPVLMMAQFVLLSSCICWVSAKVKPETNTWVQAVYWRDNHPAKQE